MPDIPVPGSRLTLVIHGPEIFDSGEIVTLIAKIRPSRVIVAGVMARTAAEESGIDCECIGIPPSLVIRGTEDPVILANEGKTGESGRIFGEIVASRLLPRGLVHIEVSGRTVYAWNTDPCGLAAVAARTLGYDLETRSATQCPTSMERTIRGCREGEAVYVNGTIIGTAIAREVVVQLRDGKLAAVSGLAVKAHGMEKVNRSPPSDLSTTWCKSGTIRSASPRPAPRDRKAGRVIVIDHCGHEIYRLLTPDVCGILSVGDDTTAVCGHIGLHRGIPVFGIIDGDRDGILVESFVEGSVLAMALYERDDDIGTEVAGMVPEYPVEWDRFTREMIDYLSGRVDIFRTGEPSGSGG